MEGGRVEHGGRESKEGGLTGGEDERVCVLLRK